MSDISDVDGAQFARTYRLWSRWFLIDSQRLSVFPRVQIPSKRGGLFALPFRDKIPVAKVSYHRRRKALFHPWSRSTTQQIWRSFKYGLHFVSYRVIYTWNHWKMSYIIHWYTLHTCHTLLYDLYVVVFDPVQKNLLQDALLQHLDISSVLAGQLKQVSLAATNELQQIIIKINSANWFVSSKASTN